jgi:hypothetical protein
MQLEKSELNGRVIVSSSTLRTLGQSNNESLEAPKEEYTNVEFDGGYDK